MDNYKDTAFRMYADSIILHNNKSWFNSCYLSGYVVECYCKLVLDNALTEGHVLKRDPLRDYSHSVKAMTYNELNRLITSSYATSKYCLDLRSDCSTIFNQWHPNNRYGDNTSTWNIESTSLDFKNEMETVIEQIKNMQLDGVI